mgnify:CR=1 FL=1
MYDLIKEAKQRQNEYRARHGQEPEFLIMSTETMRSLVDEFNHQKRKGPWRTPQIKGRPFLLMGLKIRICETIDGVHVAG